jgi:hypothetical protein
LTSTSPGRIPVGKLAYIPAVVDGRKVASNASG